MTYIYLAAPYSDPRPSTVIRRHKRALAAAAELTAAGCYVFAPTVLGHVIEERMEARTKPSHAWWLEWCIRFLRPADYLYVLTLPGWEESKGLGIEVRFAAQNGIPIIGCDILTECESVSGFDIKGWFLAEEPAEASPVVPRDDIR